MVGIADDSVDVRKRRAFRPKRRLNPRQIRALLLHYRIKLKELSEQADVDRSRAVADTAEPVRRAVTRIRVLFSATDRLYHTTTKIFQIVECRNCRLIRLSPQPTPLELREYYPPDYWFVPNPPPPTAWSRRTGAS